MQAAANAIIAESSSSTVNHTPGDQLNLEPHKPEATSTLTTATAPGHWVLARLGKKILRPGGLAATRMLLSQMNITRTDHMVEFAPGLGVTAQMILDKKPASYTAVERDVP